MRKTVWLSEAQEARRVALGVTMPQLIEAGLAVLEGHSPLLKVSPDLQGAVAQATALLDAFTRGRIAILPDQKTGLS